VSTDIEFQLSKGLPMQDDKVIPSVDKDAIVPVVDAPAVVAPVVTPAPATVEEKK
jgi:hypothetical protein